MAFRGRCWILAAASDREIGAWRSVTQEEEITHDTPVRRGSGFVNLRGRPTPPQTTAQDQPALEDEESCGQAPNVPMDDHRSNKYPSRCFFSLNPRLDVVLLVCGSAHTVAQALSQIVSECFTKLLSHQGRNVLNYQ